MTEKVYIAGPFFNIRQRLIIEQIEIMCKKIKLDFYSPMRDCIYEKGTTDPKNIFAENLKQINIADIIVVVTDGKDVGTMFEAGYAFGKTPIVYIWLDNKGMNFNIMLYESAAVVCTQYNHLEYTLTYYHATGMLKQHAEVKFPELQ